MREILFRGKRTDGGEWVYGYIYQDGLIGCNIFQTNPHLAAYIVDPSTIGQYTGLTDKNGKKIFEGDIVLRHDKKAEVRYQPSEFVLVFPDNPYPQCGLLTTSYLNEGIEVIGNIHDNPELLKEAL